MNYKIVVIILFLSSCAYHRAYKDRECNHNHICCDSGCACCGRKVGDLKPKEVKKSKWTKE